MKRGKLALGTLVATLVLLMASPAWAVLLTKADWQMNETTGPMIDSSGNNNNGNPTDVVRTGSTYVFNGSTSRVAVPDNNSLDPLEKDITLKARVNVTNQPMDDDSYDIVRKGLSGNPGGDYKMEIQRRGDPTVGKLHCLFKGTGGTVRKVAKVDGRSYTQTGSAGSISNSKEVLVGAKTTNPFDDMFDGSMDFVSIHISQ
jgi:hypothetical protein